MRNSAFLIANFMMATTLVLGGGDSHAKPAVKTDVKKVSQPVVENPNISHCTFDPPQPRKKWEWKTAHLTAHFIKTSGGVYQTDILAGASHIDERLPIASITKFMTALVIFDAIDNGKLKPQQLIDVMPDSYCLNYNNFATKFLQIGLKQIPVSDALTHTLKLSSNTMAVNLAIAVSGSVEKFVELMNEKAKQWGMKNTHFINPHGLPEGDRTSEYTTASDMLIMAERAMPKFKRLKEYSIAPLNYLRVPESEVPHHEHSEFYKLGAVYKTGTIDNCNSLLTVAEVGDHKIVDIQLCGRRETRFQNALSVLKAGWKKFANMAISPAMANEKNDHASGQISKKSLPPAQPSTP